MPEYDRELEDLVRRLNAAGPSRGAAGRGEAEAEPLAPLGLEPEAGESGRGGSGALDAVLREAVTRGASDVLLVEGSSAVFRLRGGLAKAAGPPLTDEAIRAMLGPLLTGEHVRQLERDLSADFSFARKGLGRFRMNVHFQRGTMGAAIRALPAEVPTLASLHLPPSLEALVDSKRGLILVTGPAGSGKTTTMAALIGVINQRHACHVVTVEDPIEYRHVNQRAIVEQIEVGRDARSFAAALRSVLRQSPEVILIGEIRDTETMAAAITAAETGHLVLATLHTADAVRAVGRIVDSFPPEQQNQVRQQLSLGLAAVIAQQLVPSADGRGRWVAAEILRANHAVANLIRRGEDHMLRSQLSLGRSEGMLMMEESLGRLVAEGKITAETALAHTQRPDELRRFLAG